MRLRHEVGVREVRRRGTLLVLETDDVCRLERREAHDRAREGRGRDGPGEVDCRGVADVIRSAAVAERLGRHAVCEREHKADVGALLVRNFRHNRHRKEGLAGKARVPDADPRKGGVDVTIVVLRRKSNGALRHDRVELRIVIVDHLRCRRLEDARGRERRRHCRGIQLDVEIVPGGLSKGDEVLAEEAHVRRLTIHEETEGLLVSALLLRVRPLELDRDIRPVRGLARLDQLLEAVLERTTIGETFFDVHGLQEAYMWRGVEICEERSESMGPQVQMGRLRTGSWPQPAGLGGSPRSLILPRARLPPRETT